MKFTTRKYSFIYKLLTIMGILCFALSGLVSQEPDEEYLDDEKLISDRDRGRPNLYDRTMQGRRSRYRHQRRKYYQRYYYPCPPYCPKEKEQDPRIEQDETGYQESTG